MAHSLSLNEDEEGHSDIQSDVSDDQEEFDQAAPRRMTRQLNISKTYVRKWTATDGFREFYQNWRDAIIETFNVRECFRPQYEEDNRFIRVVMPQPNTSPLKYMGFIEFNKKTGRVLIANASPVSRLEPKHLQLGKTTKDQNSAMAGSHGEGFKVAAMVMSRAGYKVRIEASNYNWSFHFGGPLKTQFRCGLNPSKRSASSITDLHQQMIPMPEFKSRISRDVAVTIGPGYSASRKVTREEFIDWLGVTFNIQGLSTPSDIVETSDGDLILDPCFANKTYLKGLLLPNSAAGASKFQYGYNFRYGQINRDREQLTSVHEEARRLALLWQKAIEHRRDEVLPKYVAILRGSPRSPDVSYADQHVNNATAKKIWAHLLAEAGGERFYYWDKQDKDVGVITQSLKKEPVGIPEVLWNILRNARLIRTPEEERVQCFRNAQQSAVPDSIFSKTVERMLKACLLLHEHTKSLDIVFVDCDHSDMDVLFEAALQKFKVHRKWLSYHAIHEEYPCRISVAGSCEPDDYFYCGHIVEKLYEHLIEVFLGDSAVPAKKKQWRKLFQRVHEVFDEMPRKVTVQHPSKGLETWVILHGEECAAKAKQLLHEVDSTSCGCVQKVISSTSSSYTVIFDSLCQSQTYFPMVARDERNAFYGIPPNLFVRPRPPRNYFWETWNATVFPKMFRMLTSCDDHMECQSSNGPWVETLESKRLGWRFEREEYLSVTVASVASPGETSRCVINVHGMCHSQDISDDEGTLLVTKYSFLHNLSSIFTLNDANKHGGFDEREVYLEFKHIHVMGLRYDADFLSVQKITDVRAVELHHRVDVPNGLASRALFCRFAIRKDGSEDAACLTPLASHLLPELNWWPRPSYSSQFDPTVLDLSPGVLGLADGFRQAGFAIDTGFCFDPESHLTWKAAYGSSIVFDGSLQSVLEDMESKTLKAPQGISQDRPVIAILGIPNKGISYRQEQIHQDLEILDNVRSILTSSIKLDFLIFTFPSWVFQKVAYVKLFRCIYGLLENRFCVHLKKIDLGHYGILQESTMIALLASPVCSPVRWPETFSEDYRTFDFTERIHDLRFTNSREDPNTIVCKHKAEDLNVYNHQQRMQWAEREKYLDPATASTTRDLRHKTRPDGEMLTVRELARIQGFNDDFIFFGSLARQYEDVIRAFPPPIAKKLADVILELVSQFRNSVGALDGNVSQRGQKRRRSD